MDTLHLMTVYVAVAEEESFAGGARRLRMSPPAVTRAVAALEDQLGVKLLNRTTRYVRATEAGQRYLDDARRILAEVEEAGAAAAGINAAPRGQLAVTAPVLFGRRYVLPGILEFLRRYPAVDVSAVFVDRVVNLLEEGLDVGIRIGELPDSSLKAVRVGSIRRVVCASPAYLETYGTPATPADLANHSIIAATAVTLTHDWKFGQDGDIRVVRINPRLAVNNNDAAVAAAVEGFGIARLLSYQTAEQVQSGQLTRILTDFEPPAMPIHVVHREGRYPSAKIRSFVDWIAARLRADEALRG